MFAWWCYIFHTNRCLANELGSVARFVIITIITDCGNVPFVTLNTIVIYPARHGLLNRKMVPVFGTLFVCRVPWGRLPKKVIKAAIGDAALGSGHFTWSCRGLRVGLNEVSTRENGFSWNGEID